MTASRSARERKAAAQAGPLAQLRIDLDEREQFVYKVRCVECVGRGEASWSTYRPGEDNGFMAALDRWILHLDAKHPAADAPCLAYLPEAQQRLHDRRRQRDTGPGAPDS